MVTNKILPSIRFLKSTIKKDIDKNKDFIIPSSKAFYNFHVKMNLGPTTFYQYYMSKLLNNLGNINWFVTDFAKCYTSNDKFRIASKYCNKYLKKQIDYLKPKIVVLFGGDVINNFRKYFDKTIDKQIKITDAHGKLINKKTDYQIIASIFPSQSSANKWMQYEIKMYSPNDTTLIRRIKQELIVFDKQ